MNYHAIIFDLDGTIADTNHIWENATRQFFKQKGVVITPEIEHELEEKIAGLATPFSCKIIKDMFNFEESVEEIMKQKQRLVLQGYQGNLRFIRGFVTFHRTATKQYGLKSGIATNCDNHALQVTSDKLGLPRFFGQDIYNLAHVNNVPKPHPDLYLYVADKLKVDPKNCIAIEDSRNGLLAAKDAGMYCIGIDTNKRREFLDPADEIVDYYRQIDLEKILKKSA